MCVASIIISTRDRVDSLRRTVDALSRLALPSHFCVELIVVDNGSKDATPSFLHSLGQRVGPLEFIALAQPKRGKSLALNLALSIARGEILLFTDDDVIQPHDWVVRMTAPLLAGEADAVAGGLKLGLAIKATGVGPAQESWLASTEYCKRPDDPPLIGANMAIARHVFDTVPWFDPEVGPGAIGHAEDTLFWLQVRAAKFRIISRYDIIAEHNPDPSRTSWKAMAQLAEKHGEFSAYVDYHWNQVPRRHPRLALARAAAKLWAARVAHLPQWLSAKTLPEWKMAPLEEFYFRNHLIAEGNRPPNYDRHGYTKRAGILPPTSRYSSEERENSCATNSSDISLPAAPSSFSRAVLNEREGTPSSNKKPTPAPSALK